MFDILEYIKNFLKIDNKAQVRRWEDVFNQMAVHTRKRKPMELLLKQRPNEESHILNYRLENYRPITYGSMNRAMDSVGRILNKIQYEVVVDDKTRAYLDKKQFEKEKTAYDFFTYFEKIVFKRTIEDPNGFLAWLPTGRGVEDNGFEVEPKPFFFSLYQIRDINQDVIAFLSDEKSQIISGGDVFDGEVFYILTKTKFYKLVQVSKDKRVKYRLDEIYTHNIGEIPAIVLGGDMNADGYFESYFAPYTAFGDEAISTFSDWQAIKVTSGFPYREEFYTECEIKVAEKPDKSSDPISKVEQKYRRKTELDKFPRTPYNTIIRKIPGNKADSEISGERILPVDIPSLRFISPDIETLRYTGESWEKLIEMAEDALHLNLGNNSNQTEGAKRMDKEEHYAMIDKVSNNFFNHQMLNSIKFIDCYLRMIPFEKSDATINTPSTFVLKTEMDLVNEISELKTNNAPSIFLSEATIELAKKRFNGSPLSKKIFDLICIVDPLFIYSINEKMSLVNSGACSTDAYISSVYAYTILQRMAMEMKDFLTADYNKIEIRYKELLQPYIESVSVTPLFNEAGMETGKEDSPGKIPLALQQLAMARERATTAGGYDLADKIGAKIDELLSSI